MGIHNNFHRLWFYFICTYLSPTIYAWPQQQQLCIRLWIIKSFLIPLLLYVIFLNIVVFRYFEAWVGTTRAGSLVVAYGSQSCVQTIQPLLLFILLGDDGMGIYIAL